MKQGMLRRPPLRTIKLYHHCTIDLLTAQLAAGEGQVGADIPSCRRTSRRFWRAAVSTGPVCAPGPVGRAPSAQAR